jgi:hypothetical protein
MCGRYQSRDDRLRKPTINCQPLVQGRPVQFVRSPEQKLQTREEMEVVFTLLAERYERGSVLLTSNLPFSKWEGIF